MQVLQTMLSIDQQLHSFILTVRFFDLKNLLLCSLELKKHTFLASNEKLVWKKSG